MLPSVLRLVLSRKGNYLTTVVLTAILANMVLELGLFAVRACCQIGHLQVKMRAALARLGTGGLIFRIGHNLTPPRVLFLCGLYSRSPAQPQDLAPQSFFPDMRTIL